MLLPFPYFLLLPPPINAVEQKSFFECHLSANLRRPCWKAIGPAWDGTLILSATGQPEKILGHKQLLVLSLVSLSLVTGNQESYFNSLNFISQLPIFFLNNLCLWSVTSNFHFKCYCNLRIEGKLPIPAFWVCQDCLKVIIYHLKICKRAG